VYRKLWNKSCKALHGTVTGLSTNVLYNLFVFLVCSATSLYNYVKKVDYNEALEHLVIDIVTQMLGKINCLVIINDNIQQDIFGGHFFKKVGSVPYYKVFNYRS
jgi:hypothetical protein